MSDRRELVNDWLRSNGGPRRFERGASSDELAVGEYLRSRGYALSWTSMSKGGGRKAIVKSANGRSRAPMKMRDLLAFVDELRAAEGREPLVRTAA